ncbi:hypothetical protein TNCV_1476581 [Trichonephila clavipes]|nr:hypothetical protein TNCV_1476581 [Trichonephila clavipes]
MKAETLTYLGNGTRNVPPSHIEMHLGIEVKKPGLRGSFLISGLEGAKGCGYDDCFGDIQCDGNSLKYWVSHKKNPLNGRMKWKIMIYLSVL